MVKGVEKVGFLPLSPFLVMELDSFVAFLLLACSSLCRHPPVPTIFCLRPLSIPTNPCQVILIQEQLSKNRIIIDMDSKGR